MDLDSVAAQLLNYLESIETKYLAWGYVEGGFTPEELHELVTGWVGDHEVTDSGVDPEELINRLYELKVIINDPYRNIWRTRMAETVRLLAYLRQWFPGQTWQVAKSLVGDFRFSAKPRLFPKRIIPVSSVISELKPLITTSQKQYVEALLPSHYKLATFQVNAAKTMLADLRLQDSSGMIVCAHTGTGKTLSFYLPALVDIAGRVEQSSNSTKALALYPRNELLKDQLVEAYVNCRRLDVVMRNKRKITVGALYGDTPYNAQYVKKQTDYNPWEKTATGYVCPFFRCPNPKCNSKLVWKLADIDSNIERLCCTNSDCGQTIEPDEIVLTRQRMRISPPDILFTTTEMLNRSMSDSNLRHLFGIGVHHPPRLMLLDEVHTYTGTHGAQVALLIRRWRTMIGSPVHITGLSATLRDAKEFFSQLTGLDITKVQGIDMGHEMELEGQEYQAILRGDPSSGAALLSTTIQVGMLLRRVLDVEKQYPSNELFGQKVFMFTDDLDVTNRLFHNLLSAEGRNSRGLVKPDSVPLAQLRAAFSNGGSLADERMRFAAGQTWLMAEEIGHVLNNRLVVGRTSSQDRGVSEDADIIVATATLEVGYNDPSVGAVIQHKSPQDYASFLQRKGRAGRTRKMRPWTVTVLSDYGRDRIMYQGYENLFNPIVPKRSLPIDNRYVLKMQAVYCLLDWLCIRCRNQGCFISAWRLLSGPATDDSARAQQRMAADHLRLLCEDESVRFQFINFLKHALQIDDDTVVSVMWESPRSIMLSVVPTLLRRLDGNWKLYSGETYDHYFKSSPLPEFIPSNLFTDLNLPETQVYIEQRRREIQVIQLPLLQAMSVLSPGRVTRRFGLHSIADNHWVPINLAPGDQDFNVKTCMDIEFLGDAQLELAPGEIISVPFLRPWKFKSALAPANVSPTSNSRLIWRSQLFPTTCLESGQENKDHYITVPKSSPWSRIVEEIRPYTHNQHSTVTVRRLAVGAEANIRMSNGSRFDSFIKFKESTGAPVAVGFNLTVDGIAFKVKIPNDPYLDATDPNRGKIQAFRVSYFRNLVQTDQRLNGVANIFERERLSEAYLSALVATALQENTSLEQACKILSKFPLKVVLTKVLKVIFQYGANDEEDILAEPGEGPTMIERLLNVCDNPQVARVLNEAASVLWQTPDQGWHTWSKVRFKATLGAALLQACKEVSESVHSSELYLDLDAGPDPTEGNSVTDGTDTIFITEATGGGCGVVEEVIQQIQNDPRRFFRLVEGALGPSDFEYIDSELRRVLRILSEDGQLKQLFNIIRNSGGYASSGDAVERLPSYLTEKGILATHTVLNSMFTRVLRPGSSELTDKLLLDLMEQWDEQEGRLGIEIEARVFAYVCSSTEQITKMFESALQHIDAKTLLDKGFRYQTIYSLLWPRGYQIRSRALEYYNPFAITIPTDRELLKDFIAKERQVNISDPDWRSEVSKILERDGTVRIIAQRHETGKLSEAILDLAAMPSTIEFMHVYPRIEGIHLESDQFVVTLDIREVVD